jgi:membrane-bound lytic murein transglycosylase B
MGKIIKNILITFTIIVLFSSTIEAKDYTKKWAVKSFINKMVKKHGLNKKHLNKLFKNVKMQRRALGIFNPKYRVKPKKSSKPSSKKVPSKKWSKYHPKYGSWTRYEERLLTPAKIKMGAEYLYKHKDAFSKVYKEYGVPPEYVAAIIGIESRYGLKRGTYPVFDTLTTLAFEPNRRNEFFKYELENLLLIARSQKISPKTIKGSYAGAIGLGQFMPSSYAPFCVDCNEDGIKSMQNDADAIGSIANYLKKNGWKKWQPVAERVTFKGGKRYHGRKTGYKIKYSQNSVKELKLKYGTWDYKGDVRLIKLNRYRFDELWFAADNFYVITRYNHDEHYAMVVHQLAQKLIRTYKNMYGVTLR